MPQRCVAHLDMDAFYVSVELRRRPELRGRPVIVAGTGPRSVVTTASYEARSYGVGSAMPAARAHRLCPDGVFLAPDFPYYRQVSREAMAILRRQAEAVEVVGLDEAYLDLTGLASGDGLASLERPVEAMREVVRELAANLGLAASVGIGPNKLVAKVASAAEKPRGFVVLSRRAARERFAGSRCGLIPGIGPRTVERLTASGIDTIGQLAGTPFEHLAGAFGARGAAHLQTLARFEHDGAVSEARKVISESRETTFDSDIADPARLQEILEHLVADLCQTLQRQHRQGRTIGIKIRLDDFSTHTRARTLSVPVNRAEQVGPVARELLRRFAAPRPVRLLGVRVAGLEQHSPEARGQLSLAI